METRKLLEALRKQGIHVHESDPVLETAVVCDVVLADALKSVEGVTKRAVDQFAAVGVQAEASARAVASDVITRASDYLAVRFKESAEEVVAAMLAQMRQEAERAEASSRVAVRAAWAVGAIGAGALSLMIGIGLAAL